MFMCENCIVLRILEHIKFLSQDSIHVMKLKCFNAHKSLGNDMSWVIYTESLVLKWVTSTHVHRAISSTLLWPMVCCSGGIPQTV